MNARLLFGGLLLLGLADLGLLNFSLSPRLAEEQARQQSESGRTAGRSTAQPTAPRPSAVPSPSVAVAPSTARTEVPAPPPTPTPSVVATTEPTTSAVAASGPPEPATPTPAPTPTPTAQRPEPPSKPPVAVASGDKPEPVPDLLFELDSNLLTLTAKEALDEALKQLKANPSLRIHIRGHSDQLGSHEHNLELSRRRAAAVENYIRASGVPGSKISVEAVGGTRPSDSSNTPTAWARNRRVEIEWR